MTAPITSREEPHKTRRLSASTAVFRLRSPVLKNNDKSRTKISSESKTMFFQPTPTSRKLSGPVFYYRDIRRIEKNQRADHYRQVMDKEFKKQINSPYHEDFVQLRENSLITTKNRLDKEKQDWIKQRGRDVRSSLKAIENDIKHEKRHCHKDVLTRTHPIIHVLDF